MPFCRRTARFTLRSLVWWNPTQGACSSSKAVHSAPSAAEWWNPTRGACPSSKAVHSAPSAAEWWNPTRGACSSLKALHSAPYAVERWNPARGACSSSKALHSAPSAVEWSGVPHPPHPPQPRGTRSPATRHTLPSHAAHAPQPVQHIRSTPRPRGWLADDRGTTARAGVGCAACSAPTKGHRGEATLRGRSTVSPEPRRPFGGALRAAHPERAAHSTKVESSRKITK